ncbi:hypothetical protein MJO28_013468 [Puccinia striiformis f. sp. tritici]|uniref:Uncharacterized protein n=1 Tax=Puccinia striiformis f. sp. tritici TaxID=168172 RepID=A0ACC0E097_9BASI|nr:hypothetical protein MJO28_013468 [Puccinia striiformis f. sp. tritici]
MDRPKFFPGVLLKSDSTHAPFAQPSPPPRRQSQRQWRPAQSQQSSSGLVSCRQLISPPIVRPPPPQPQWIQEQQQLKKRKLRQPKQEEAAVPQPTAATNRKSRSRIPFQWRLPSSSTSFPGGSALNQASPPGEPSHQVFPGASQPNQPFYHSPNVTPRKAPPTKPSIFRNLVRSHSISSAVSLSSRSVSQSASQIARRTPSNCSNSHARRTCSNESDNLQSMSSDDLIQIRAHPSRSSRPPSGRNISSSSSSLHLSVSYATDPEFESLSDDHEEVLSSHSHVTPLATAESNVYTPSSAPLNSRSSAHSFVSSQSSLSQVSCPSSKLPPPQCPLPPSPSASTHCSHTLKSTSELPFACPSPSMPSHRVTHRQGRPAPAKAPPLARSRTPSLVIRPKFAPSTHHLDFTTHSALSARSSHTHHPSNALDHVDHQDRLISGPKTDVMRGLGWGRSPIDPPRLISPSPSFVHNPSLSDLSSNQHLRDAIIADYILTPHSSNEPFERRSLSPQVTPLINRTKKFKDRFTLVSTAPLKLSKRQHVRHQSTSSGTGQRITSSLLGALSPTRNRHTVMGLEEEKRKVEFKRMISYPVLNHNTRGDDETEERNYQSEPDLNCYNLSIEAAMRSLEGIEHIDETASMNTPVKSTTSDRPISWIFEDKPDLSDVEASQEFSFTSEKSDIWKQKLRRRVSVNRLMMKSRSKPASSPSPLRNKASGRLRPLIRKVSSVSLRQRAWIGEPESGVAFAAHNLRRTAEENEEEEELALGRTPVRRANPARLNQSKPESRLQQICSSISRGHTPRSASSPTVSLSTPQRGKRFPKSSESIREKRKIFERPSNPSADSVFHNPRSVISSMSISLASSSHSISMGAMSTCSDVDRRSSGMSERRQSKRKPTPAEIKLKAETQSVKALVDKFETQNHHSSLGRSIGSDSPKKRPRESSKAGRSSNTGVIRTSLLSLWSGDRSSMSSRGVVSRSSSRQFIIKQRRKANSRSCHSHTSSMGAIEGEVKLVRKLKKKPKKIFRDNDSSSSSFGCAFDEEDEYAYELQAPHADLSLPVKLPGSADSSNPHFSMILPKSSRQRKRSTWSANNSSPTAPSDDSQKLYDELNVSSFTSRSTLSNASRSDCTSYEAEDQDMMGSKPKLLSDKDSFEPVGSNQDETCSPLSSEQAHQAHTILEPQTVWMGDGSQRNILIAGGCLHVAKKIPFPSFEDDAEFTQSINFQQRCSSAEPLPHKLVSQPAEQPRQINRLSTFLRTRKFDDELEDDEADGASLRDRSTRTSLQQKEETGMLSPMAIGSLQDSPTLGRGRRPRQRSKSFSCSRPSLTSSPEKMHPTPAFLLAPASDYGETENAQSCSSGAGMGNTLGIQQNHLGVQRCEGLGNKMFGSSMDIPQHVQDSPISRRATSAYIPSGVARVFPLSPTASCPSPSTPQFQSRSPDSPAPANNSPGEPLNSFTPPLVSTSSSMLKCERLDQLKEDRSALMSDDLSDFGERTLQKHQPKDAKRRVSSAPIQSRGTSANRTSRLYAEALDDFGIADICEMTDKALRNEIDRLERVRKEWRMLCLEVQDVLKTSRERWPDQGQAHQVLKEFVNPIEKSSISTFLETSRRLYKQRSTHQFTSTEVSSNQVEDLTPPSRHPFGRQSIISLSVGTLRPKARGRRSTNNRAQAQKGLPILITRPVPSAFVSPERFHGCARAPQSEPRGTKLSNRSKRQPTLSNRLGGPSVKPVNTRGQRGRMMSGTSISNVSFTSAKGKVILSERSVNLLPTTTYQGTGRTAGEKRESTSYATSGRTLGSLGRVSRPSISKWDSENEGVPWTSASVRETRKPWRRSILHKEFLPREPRLSLADSATGSVGSAPEEVGVLVAAGEQPREFSSGLHYSGSFRLKHRRKLNQIRNE